jgi:hypothetical protein
VSNWTADRLPISVVPLPGEELESWIAAYARRRARGLPGPGRERRVKQRRAQRRRDRHGERDRLWPGQSQDRDVQGDPEQEAHRQRDVAGGRDRPGRGGHHRQHRQRPAAQHDDEGAGHQRDE